MFNLQVLPIKLLIFAIPLSLAEVIIAGIIIKKIEQNNQTKLTIAKKF
jgi:hypothetical protein